MPTYYTLTRSATTNATGNTCAEHVRLITVSNQQNCGVAQITGCVRNSTTAGSGFLSVIQYSASSSAGGTSVTPQEMNPAGSAAQTTAFTDATAFTSYPSGTRLFAVGFSQTGGQGGWMALERDNCFILNPGGGAAGNLALDSFSATASQALEVSVQFLEG